MEPFLADIINNSKIPKPIRIGIVIVLITFIIIISLICIFNSPFLYGKIFGFLLIVVSIGILIFLCKKISKE